MANLFILPSCLGDTILTLGGVDLYRDEPAVVVASPRSAALFEDMPNLERLLVVGKKPWKGHWLDIWKETRGRSWNNIVDLKGSALGFTLSAKKRRMWTHRADLKHKVYQISTFFGSDTPIHPTLWISEERMQRVRPSRPTLGVAPIPGWLGKQWPLENFIALLQQFCRTYPEAQVAVFAAPSERNLVTPLLEALPKDQCVDTIGGPLLDSAALIKASRVFLANDSGLMHLSSAVRTPTIALFGPSNEHIYGPWSDIQPSPHRAIRGEPFTGNVRQVNTDTKCYMTKLTVPPVWEVLQERWEALEDMKVVVG